MLKPLCEVVPQPFRRGAVGVFQLKTRIISCDAGFLVVAHRATPAPPPKRRRAKRSAKAGAVPREKAGSGAKPGKPGAVPLEEAESDFSNSETATGSSGSMLPASGSDNEGSLCSIADSAVEEPAPDDAAPVEPEATALEEAPGPEEDTDRDAAEPRLAGRALAHTHTAWSNDYFVLTDNRNYGNVRMRVHSRWTNPADLGKTLSSKTLVPTHFGDARDEPDQIVLVLKAWMLHRWAVDDGRFLKLRTSRLAAWRREEADLRTEIRRRGGEAVLHHLAIAMIR